MVCELDVHKSPNLVQSYTNILVLAIKNAYFCTFLSKYLVMSKKSSTFAPAFEWKYAFSRDSVAQQVEHIPFKDGVLGSSPSWITKREFSLGTLFFTFYRAQYYDRVDNPYCDDKLYKVFFGWSCRNGCCCKWHKWGQLVLKKKRRWYYLLFFVL